MNTAVVELDTLTDTVRAAAKNHNLLTVGIYRALVRSIVGGVVVSLVFGTAYMYAFPALGDIVRKTQFTYCSLACAGQLCDILIGKTVLLQAGHTL